MNSPTTRAYLKLVVHELANDSCLLEWYKKQVRKKVHDVTGIMKYNFILAKIYLTTDSCEESRETKRMTGDVDMSVFSFSMQLRRDFT